MNVWRTTDGEGRAGIGVQIPKRPWLMIGATLSLVLLALLAPLPAAGAVPQERHVVVSARSFAFEPWTVRVNRGDTVVLTLEATDVVHGLYLDGYGVSAVAEPGRPAILRFVASRPGAFRFRCSITCGTMHPFMIGKLVVGPNLVALRAALATLITAAGALIVFWPR
jgi:heme/copper-type cytochrome/quinol oxidase subunit 2